MYLHGNAVIWHWWCYFTVCRRCHWHWWQRLRSQSWQPLLMPQFQSFRHAPIQCANSLWIVFRDGFKLLLHSDPQGLKSLSNGLEARWGGNSVIDLIVGATMALAEVVVHWPLIISWMMWRRRRRWTRQIWILRILGKDLRWDKRSEWSRAWKTLWLIEPIFAWLLFLFQNHKAFHALVQY